MLEIKCKGASTDVGWQAHWNSCRNVSEASSELELPQVDIA
jgi:hypothetical protein